MTRHAKPLSRPVLRLAAIIIVGVGATGCATVNQMSDDFDKKWDDPQAVLAEMKATAPKVEAAATTPDKMLAFNRSDCARKFDLLTPKEDGAPLIERQISAGECMLEQGRNADAEKLFAIAGEGGDVRALQGRGVALVRLERFDEAVAALDAAVAADAGLWRAWNALGVARDHRGDIEGAKTAFRKAAEANPKDGSALNNLGVALTKNGERAAAIEAFTAALGVDGARASAEANLRLAYALDGKYADSLRATPDDRMAVAYNNAGVAAASRGDNEEARRLFKMAIEASPRFYAKAYNNLSLLVR